MRIPTLLTALVLVCAPLAQAASGQSAAANSMPACDGVLNIFRISEITPGGSMDKFMAAVAAHQAWYASHGYPDIIFAARLLTRDAQSGAMAYSETQVATYHYTTLKGQPPTHDAAWDAYVKMYSNTSTIKETQVNCVPAANAPAGMK